MGDLILPRRRFLKGLLGLVAAPAIVKIENLMPVKFVEPVLKAYDAFGNEYEAYTSYFRTQYALVPGDWLYSFRTVLLDAERRVA